jgi:NAD(P)-dependent dehydrogenase (short-subunit alcohol dehydrogenase family)
MIQSLKAIKATINQAKHVCLFGMGSLIVECYNQILLFIGREPDFFCDNDPSKWGNRCFGKMCISPSQLSTLSCETVVIVAVKNYEEIYQQLDDMGVKDIFVCCYDRGYNILCAVKNPKEERLVTSEEWTCSDKIKGKWTLVTGAARGVGRQIAIEMATLGSNIIAHSRAVEHVKEIINICSNLGVETLAIEAEFSNLDEVESMLSQLEHSAPKIDIIFNNAAISPQCPKGLWYTSSEIYLKCFTVNTIAPIRICQRFIPQMIRRGFGRITNITSSIQKKPAEIAYACSKAALDKFVHDLAPSLQGTGVTITLADPGWLRTDMGGSEAPKHVETVIPGILLGALLNKDINGRWFSAQDYSGLSIERAMQKAQFVSNFVTSKNKPNLLKKSKVYV